MIEYDSLILFCLFLSSVNLFCCGMFYFSYLQLKSNRIKISNKCEEFDKITKTAVSSNNSLAEKIISIDDKIHNLEMYVNHRK